MLSWDLTPEVLIAHACATANRKLTADERGNYLPGGRAESTCPGR